MARKLTFISGVKSISYSGLLTQEIKKNNISTYNHRSLHTWKKWNLLSLSYYWIVSRYILHYCVDTTRISCTNFNWIRKPTKCNVLTLKRWSYVFFFSIQTLLDSLTWFQFFFSLLRLMIIKLASLLFVFFTGLT